MKKDRKIAPGIYRTARGHRAFARVRDPRFPNGRLASKRFGKDVTLLAMKQWQEDARSLARRTPVTLPPEPPTGFAADAATYLQTVRAMPTIRDRRQHIQEWVTLFGDRPRAAISSAEIRAQRDRWLTTGPRRVYRQHEGAWQWVPIAKPLAAGSVNRRLRALENLWTVLDGPKASNPVRDVQECEEPAPQARGTTFEIVLELLAHMPDHTRPVKGELRETGSKTRARMAVMLWTGLAHGQIAQLTEADVDYQTMTYFRPRRKKGRRGSRNRPVQAERPKPLLPQAAAALRHFFAIGADGPFSRSALHKSFRRALHAANEARWRRHIPRSGKPDLIDEAMRVYDIKHTFGREAYAAGKDLRAVQELLGLSRIELADRYAYAAVGPAAATAAAALAIRAGETSPPEVTSVKKIERSA